MATRPLESLISMAPPKQAFSTTCRLEHTCASCGNTFLEPHITLRAKNWCYDPDGLVQHPNRAMSRKVLARVQECWQDVGRQRGDGCGADTGAGKGSFIGNLEEQHLCQHPLFCQYPCQHPCPHFSVYHLICVLYQDVRIVKTSAKPDLDTAQAFVRRGRGTAGKCAGPQWSRQTFWPTSPYSELGFRINKVWLDRNGPIGSM